MAEECGLLNLASCIPEKIYEFILNIINAPLKPLLNLTKTLLVEPIRIDLIVPIWAIIIYIFSLFYGLLIIYSGFNFIVSGHDVLRRVKAKLFFQNIFIMIILVQTSYFLYSLCIDLSSLMTAGIINLIDESFFLLTADNVVNIGLQFFFGSLYVITLITTVLLLTIRYLFILVGLVLCPIGIFLYFIPPTKEYGEAIFNALGSYLLVPFFSGLILLASSKMLEIGAFESFKILVMIASFSIVNLFMFYVIIFALIKSILSKSSKNIMTASKIAGWFT
jgi:hypothetical protein